MAISPRATAWILRIFGLFDLLLAIACLATPVVKERMGMGAYAIAAMLLVGTFSLFYMAHRAERRAAHTRT